MSQRAITLPIQTVSIIRPTCAQWVCRRCLATQATATSNPSAKDPSEIPNYDPTLPASQRDYRLNKTDFYLKKPLPHPIPLQLLRHSTSEILHENERAQREKIEPQKKLQGVVVRAGFMNKTVKVRVPGQQWNKKIGKYYDSFTNHLVHDPNSSLVTGDVVELHRFRVTANVRHVVAAIISPYGKPIEDRPPVPTADERLAAYKELRFAKLKRRSLRREAAQGNVEAIRELQSMGLDPGRGIEVNNSKSTSTHEGAGESEITQKPGILGKKGQLLPKGVLPGGKHEVGKINDRARLNKKKAMELDTKAEENLLEAEEKGERLESMGLASDSVLPQK